MIVIENINKHKQHETAVASWLLAEWGTKGSEKYWQDWVAYSQNDDSIFQTFVILDNGKLVGTYGIMPCDLQSRQELGPWVGNLFVDKKYRLNSLKYFSEMQKHFSHMCKLLNLKKVYVYTPHKAIVFIRYGFKFIEFSTDVDGNKISILEKTFK